MAVMNKSLAESNKSDGSVPIYSLGAPAFDSFGAA